MKVAIISAFETYESRVCDMYTYYQKKGYKVVKIRSNFLHMSKKKYISNKEDEILLDVPNYKKNLSFQRMRSHFKFSKKVREYLEKESFDLIHVIIPPNSLCKELNKMNEETKIIYDVMDYWPETLPIPFIGNSVFLSKWRNLRDTYIDNADYILTECNLFESEILKKRNIKNIKTIYFTREKIISNNLNMNTVKDINICYLGSINNILDIDYTITLLKELNKKTPVFLHLIGDGEKKRELLLRLEKAEIQYKYYGLVYDSRKLNNIMMKCAFGLNIMKPDVFVGLTMKSINYFQHGLPIINNINHDTNELVERYYAGVNVDFNIDNSVMKILNSYSSNELYLMKKGVHDLFEDNFSVKQFTCMMDSVLKELNYD